VLDVNWVITLTVAVLKGKNVRVLEFCYVIILLPWDRYRFESVVVRQ